MNIERVLQWLDHVGDELTLVGGQAMVVWESILGLPMMTETVDIDFLGDASIAIELADILGYRFHIPNPDDSTPNTPNTAILVDEKGEVVADFLAYVVGMNETDILRRRVAITTDSGNRFFVLHPFDCLASRLANVSLLPSKRNTAGYDQLRRCPLGLEYML